MGIEALAEAASCLTDYALFSNEIVANTAQVEGLPMTTQQLLVTRSVN